MVNIITGTWVHYFLWVYSWRFSMKLQILEKFLGDTSYFELADDPYIN